MAKHRVIIIGAGIGGLCAGLELANEGLEVTILDQGQVPGGKIRQFISHGQAIDSGPTVFTMPWVFEELFEKCHVNFFEEVKTQQLPVLARHFWGKEQLDLYADPLKSAKAIREFSNAHQADLFLKFCKTAKEIYNTLEGPYIRGQRPSLVGMMRQLGLKGSKQLMSIGPFNSLWKSLADYFPDPRLQQLFGRYATYCGSSPYLAPATLMLIAHVELSGVWSIENGMVELPLTIAKLAKERGATLRHQVSVKKIIQKNQIVEGVELAHGEWIPADSVIFNGDVAALSMGLLGDDYKLLVPKTAERSLSAVTWSISANTHHFDLSRHNVFFNQHYHQEFDDIFHHKILPKKPTVYLCAQDRPSPALDSEERMLLLVNAPAIGDQDIHVQEIEKCQDYVQTLLMASGLNINLNSPQVIRQSPQDFHQRFPATSGALYGMATHGWMSAFARPSSQSSITNLYLAGGSVHPGPGVPMAALSGRLAAAALMERLALTK